MKMKACFTLDKIICRLLAAWFIFALFILRKEGNFSELSFAQDTKVYVALMFIGLIFVFISIIAYFTEVFHLDSLFLLLSELLCSLKWFKIYYQDPNLLYFAFSNAIILCLIATYFVSKNDRLFNQVRTIPSEKHKKYISILAVSLCCIFLTTVILRMSIYRYKTFLTFNFDFGLFVNMFHHMRETGVPVTTCERNMLLSHFAIHISPIFYIILPFYFIFPTPYTLEVAQALALGFGTVPVYLIARHYKLSRCSSFVLSAIYALYPIITTGCFYDFHENSFLPTIILFIFYFFEKDKYPQMYLFVVLLLMVKEDAAIYAIFFGIYIIFARKGKNHGGALIFLAIGYFIFCIFMLQSYGQGAMFNRYDNLIFNPDDGLLGAIKTILINPGYVITQLLQSNVSPTAKFMYFVYMLLPLGFLPFCTKKPTRWILLAPMLLNLISSYLYQHDIGFHYHYGIVAFLVYATIQNIADMNKETKNTMLRIALISAFCLHMAQVAPTSIGMAKDYKEYNDIYVEMEETLKLIPDDASVNATTSLIPHIANRDVIYECFYHFNVPDIEYVAVDTLYGDANDYLDAYYNLGYELFAESRRVTILVAPWVEH